VHDVIRGDTTFAHEHLDDPVIARADGSVLYNFAVAVDDLDAGITHVVRGEDHLSNAPKQLLVFEALGAPSPLYAHLPLLHGPADDPEAFAQMLGAEGAPEALADARAALAATDPFDVEHVEAALRGVVERRGAKPNEVFQPVRMAIAGTTVSPGIFESVALLGRDETLRRIDAALTRA